MTPEKSTQQGFTLIEVLITSAIFTVVLFGAYLMFDANRLTYARGEVKIDIQQNARIAMESLSRDLRLAGYGVPAVPCPVVVPAIIEARPQSISFRADLQNISTTLTTQANAGATALAVASSSGYTDGDAIYLTDGATCEPLTVNGNPPDATTLNVTPALTGTYGAGSRVLRPKDVTYDAAGNELRKDGRNVGVPPSLNPGVLADNIQGLTLRYFNDAGVDITANPVADPSVIRRIQVEIITSDIPVGQQSVTHQLQSDVSPRNL
ncbi:MAG: PilW family protein [Candidatus Methylomirabilales bacterium]